MKPLLPIMFGGVNLMAPWWVPAAVAAATVPPLVLLYFLKLKRRELPIASTLLWRKAVQDLQVNSPFQRLRNNLLLMLQLFILLLAAIAVAEPILRGHGGPGQVSILMIDRSASMSSLEGNATRLDLAKDEANRLVDNMRSNDQAIVIAFADRAQVVCALTGRKDLLHNAINGITQTDAAGRLTEAMGLAEAPMSEVGERPGEENPITSAQYVLFTDGRLPDAGTVQVKRGSLQIVRVGEAADNVGIVSLDVRRNYEQPEQISVLARVRNFGAQKTSRDVSLLVDGDLKAVRTIELGPLGAADRLGRLTLAGMPAEASETVVPFELQLPTAAQLELRLSGNDALAVDDRAFAIVAPPRPMSVLLVTAGNRFLRQLLPALPLDHYEVWSPDEYEKAPNEKLIRDGRCQFDVVILDGHSTKRLPPGSYVFFAAVPEIEGVELGDTIKGESFLDWDETHPLLRHVSIQAMTVFSWHALKVPKEAVPLIEGPGGPVMALLRRERNQYLILSFGIFDETRTYANTDWFMQESFVVFGYNAVRYLTGSSTIGQQPPVAPGEAFTVTVKPGASTVAVRRPDGQTEKLAVRESGLASYGQTDRVGIYAISPGLPGDDARAVNLANEEESFIAPNDDFHIAAGEVKTATAVERMNRPLWRYVLAGLLAVLAVEWFVYNKRVLV